MPFIALTKPSVGDPTRKQLIDDMIDNQVFMNTQSGKVGLIPNDSFEIDSDSDGNPDSWDFTDYVGGSHAIDTTNHAHGAQGIKFTSTVLANGGGYADSTDFITIAEGEQYAWKVWRKASVVNISCQLTIRWYTNAQAFISATTAFQDTNTATAYTLASGAVTAPATARFCKLRIEGGVPAVGTATGDITFDGVELKTYYLPVVISDGSQVIGTSSTWTPSAGIYQMVSSGVGAGRLELFISSSWRISDVDVPAIVYMDGANMRLNNTSGVTANTVYYQIF